MFTDINICPINNKTDHISEKYIFYTKKSKTKVDIFPILGRIWSRIRIRYFTKRIHIKMKRIRNTAYYNRLVHSTVNKILNYSVADPDPFGSVSFQSAGSGSASMKRIRIRVAKNQPKSWKIFTKINENHKNTIIFFQNY